MRTYKEIPVGAKKATGKEAFLKDGKRNIDLKYLLYSELEECWQEYAITRFTKYSTLRPFVEAGLCYTLPGKEKEWEPEWSFYSLNEQSK